MESPLRPALENLDEALTRLENTVDAQLENGGIAKPADQHELDFGGGSSKVDKAIAQKLDMTIQRLETLLNEE